jgi:hypothetical protein
MPESPELESRVVKLQKDVEEIKDELQDSWHERKDVYLSRIRNALGKNPNASQLFLQIDGTRSMNEIEDALMASGRSIPHVTLWRSSKILVSNGLVKQVGVKGTSPVFAKKPWALSLSVDEYVRKEILGETQTPST